MQIHHQTQAKAKRVSKALSTFPALSIRPEAEDGVVVWTAFHKDTPILRAPKVPSVEDIFEACSEHGLDPEEGRKRGTIVPEAYKIRYAERGDPDSCGDWLADTVRGETHGVEGFSVEDFSAMLSANRVDMSRPWAQAPFSGRPGWQGRYRMSGRQQLEKRIAATGRLFGADGKEIAVPDGVVAEMREKHPRVVVEEDCVGA